MNTTESISQTGTFKSQPGLDHISANYPDWESQKSSMDAPCYMPSGSTYACNATGLLIVSVPVWSRLS